MIQAGGERDLKALWAALFQFQGMVHGVVKDARNPHFKNTYASLEAVIEAARAPLQKCGLVFTQSPGAISDGVMDVTTIIAHPESGQSLQYTMGIPLAKHDPQGAGSAITYACRYSLMAILGLPPLDDDGNRASAPGNGSPAVAAPAHSHQAGVANPKITTGNGTTLKRLRDQLATITVAFDLDLWINSHETTQGLNLLSEPEYQAFKGEYQTKKRALASVENVGAG